MTSATERAWSKARIGNEALLHWIDAQIDRAGTFRLPPDRQLPAIGEVQARWTPQLRARTIARLIEGVLRRGVRQAKREKEEAHE